jgi:hypothetical protein
MATLHASRPCAGGGPENRPARLPTHPGADEAIKKSAKEPAFNIKTLIAPSGVDCMHAKGSA